MLKNLTLVILLTLNIYATSNDSSNPNEMDFSALSNMIEEIDTHHIYLLGKEYVDKINTQQNRDKAFKLYLKTIDNVSVLTNNAQEYIQSMDTNESKEKATLMYLESLEKINKLSAENLAKTYCGKDYIKTHKKQCDHWNSVLKENTF